MLADVLEGGVEEAYLHGLVVPAVRPVLLAPSAVEHQQGPVGVPQLQAAGLIQTHHKQAALQESQGIPISLIWMVDERQLPYKDGSFMAI